MQFFFQKKGKAIVLFTVFRCCCYSVFLLFLFQQHRERKKEWIQSQMKLMIFPYSKQVLLIITTVERCTNESVLKETANVSMHVSANWPLNMISMKTKWAVEVIWIRCQPPHTFAIQMRIEIIYVNVMIDIRWRHNHHIWRRQAVAIEQLMIIVRIMAVGPIGGYTYRNRGYRSGHKSTTILIIEDFSSDFQFSPFSLCSGQRLLGFCCCCCCFSFVCYLSLLRQSIVVKNSSKTRRTSTTI